MKLTDTACKAAKPKGNPYKKADGGGLYLLVKPDGAKYWRMKYYFLNKEKLLSIGVYPTVSLADARDIRDKAKKMLTAGVDPSYAKKDTKKKALRDALNTFEVVAREWHHNQAGQWCDKHSENVLHRLEKDIFPHIGNRPIRDIEAPELLTALRRIEQRGALDITRRVKQVCGQVFRYGISTGRCTRDIASDLKNALKVYKPRHYPALEIKEIPEFLIALEKNEARLYPRTRRAIKLLMLTLVRTSELINATWNEFDLEAGEWLIPASRMKMKRPHIVPLSSQAIALLKEQQAETEHFANCKWVFPSQIGHAKSMSNVTILGAIKNLGFNGRMTGHGFRALGMGVIKEKLKYRHEVIDRQLAHAPKNKVTAAYDRAEFLDERKKMMQDYADYLDTTASGQSVAAMKPKKSA